MKRIVPKLDSSVLSTILIGFRYFGLWFKNFKSRSSKRSRIVSRVNKCDLLNIVVKIVSKFVILKPTRTSFVFFAKLIIQGSYFFIYLQNWNTNKVRILGDGIKISYDKRDIHNSSFKFDKVDIYIYKNIDNNRKLKVLKVFFDKLGISRDSLHYELENA